MADKTFEENMTRLEEIVTRLEKGDVPLSQSLSLFEEGTRLAAACIYLRKAPSWPTPAPRNWTRRSSRW